MQEQDRSAIGHFRVLDLTPSYGEHAGRLLADLGADVIKIEPPGGAPGRRAKPFAHDVDDGEHSLSFMHHNANKRGVVLDLETSDGRDALLGLVASADAVIEDLGPGYLSALGLGYGDLKARNPAIVVTSITRPSASPGRRPRGRAAT
jgi:crotonobetainyl-CoA:carnitine CoA-transferase CaiB-like acyl-CoA transferase